MSSTDKIHKTIKLDASREKVWSALTNAKHFGTWFRVALDGEFVAGEKIRGKILHAGLEHLQWEVTIETIDAPKGYFAFRWHPYAIDPKVDYSSEPTTLVEFQLRVTRSGTILEVTESGFDKIPAHRRAEAFRMNSGGWEAQMKNIEKHVAT